jgi:hypothetical protein
MRDRWLGLGVLVLQEGFGIAIVAGNWFATIR